MEASELERIKVLEEENSRLKRMYANGSMKLDLAKNIIEKSSKSLARSGKSSPR